MDQPMVDSRLLSLLSFSVSCCWGPRVLPPTNGSEPQREYRTSFDPIHPETHGDPKITKHPWASVEEVSIPTLQGGTEKTVYGPHLDAEKPNDSKRSRTMSLGRFHPAAHLSSRRRGRTTCTIRSFHPEPP